MTVMIVVTHLLGSGHLSRALTVARAFASQGHDTHLVSGGGPVPQLDLTGVTVHQLPPLRSDGPDFSRLLTEQNTLATQADLDIRARMLMDLAHDIAPDILITELFPFGRRNLRREFIALLETASTLRPTPRIFASIRDILAPPSKPAKITFAEDIIDRYYDAVLVHSDPDVISLDDSWPVSPTLAPKLTYTGFVAPPPVTTTAREGNGEILVSAGGGSVGDPVFSAAIAAARSSKLTWRLLIGGQDFAGRIQALSRSAPANVTIEPARRDFREMLRHAAASVSLCGYNTAMDILQTGVPAVVVPFDEGNEVEQGLRAKALSHLCGFETVPMGDLDGATLNAALDRVRLAERRDTAHFRFNGAHETVRICVGFAE